MRQLRLRDIGGIIVIDFIDMANPKNRQLVEEALKAELARDRTKTYVVEISPLGLVEMTRQNVTDGPREILTRQVPGLRRRRRRRLGRDARGRRRAEAPAATSPARRPRPSWSSSHSDVADDPRRPRRRAPGGAREGDGQALRLRDEEVVPARPLRDPRGGQGRRHRGPRARAARPRLGASAQGRLRGRRRPGRGADRGRRGGAGGRAGGGGGGRGRRRRRPVGREAEEEDAPRLARRPGPQEEGARRRTAETAEAAEAVEAGAEPAGAEPEPEPEPEPVGGRRGGRRAERERRRSGRGEAQEGDAARHARRPAAEEEARPRPPPSRLRRSRTLARLSAAAGRGPLVSCLGTRP